MRLLHVHITNYYARKGQHRMLITDRNNEAVQTMTCFVGSYQLGKDGYMDGT